LQPPLRNGDQLHFPPFNTCTQVFRSYSEVPAYTWMVSHRGSLHMKEPWPTPSKIGTYQQRCSPRSFSRFGVCRLAQRAAQQSDCVASQAPKQKHEVPAFVEPEPLLEDCSREIREAHALLKASLEVGRPQLFSSYKRPLQHAGCHDCTASRAKMLAVSWAGVSLELCSWRWSHLLQR